jgi:hypothetical protein
MEGSTDVRFEFKRLHLEDFLVTVLNKTSHIMVKLMPPIMLKEIVGEKVPPEVIAELVTMTHWRLKGDFSVQLTTGSTLPMNQGARVQRALAVLQAFGQDPYISPEGQLQLRLWVLRELNIKDAEKWIKDPEQAAAFQQLQMLQGMQGGQGGGQLPGAGGPEAGSSLAGMGAGAGGMPEIPGLM